MNSIAKSLCRICLGVEATIPIFEDSKIEDDSNATIQKKLSFCLKQELYDVAGYPRYICDHCQETLDTVFEFINKYNETSRILEEGIIVVVKQENNENYEDIDDFIYPEDDTNETFGLTKKEMKVDFEDGAHFLAKIEPLCKLKTKSKGKSKKVNPLHKKTIINKSNITVFRKRSKKVMASLLEGDFVWNGEDWCLTRGLSNETIVKKYDSKKPQAENDKKERQPETETRPPDPVLCATCGKKFTNRGKLKLHEERKHNSVPVTCPVCNITIASQSYLKEHTMRKHSKSKDFVCSECGRGFALKRDLSSHNRQVHERKSVKKYKKLPCDFCDREFSNKAGLLAHERGVHTGDRPAVCTVCEASFFHEDYLKEHMRLHTGERPFECPVCGRGYAQRGNMKSHMRNHRISQLDQATLDKIKPSWYKFMKP